MFFIVFFLDGSKKMFLGLYMIILNVSRLFGGLVNKVSAKSNKYFQIYTQKLHKVKFKLVRNVSNLDLEVAKYIV